MGLKDQEEQRQFKQELERLQQQLRDAQEELLHERRDRIQEKQRELDERLARSMANVSSVVSESSLQVKERKEDTSMPTVPPLDMSSFLNTSIELPEKIKEIMDEWKKRMENAIAGTVSSISDQSFTLVNSFAENGRRVGVNTSFSSLYETSLFDVVDAMEGAAASRLESSQALTSSSHRYDISRQTLRTNQFSTMEYSDDAVLDGNGVATDTSPSTRLQRLVQGMEARERKLARLGGHNCQQNHTTDAQQHDAHMSSANGFRDARDDDFDIFNDVKDIYEKELFESRQQRGSGAAAWTSNGGTASANLHQRVTESGDDGTLGPPLSPQDLSVREAIEKEMTELLQEEAFQQLLQ